MLHACEFHESLAKIGQRQQDRATASRMRSGDREPFHPVEFHQRRLARGRRRKDRSRVGALHRRRARGGGVVVGRRHRSRRPSCGGGVRRLVGRHHQGSRAAALNRFADVLEANIGDIVTIESRNVGKPLSIVPPEIGFMVDNLRFFAGAARALTTQAPGDTSAVTRHPRREPLGVAALIAPWNYPAMMAGWKVGPALAAGNTIVLKPSELTPLSVLKIADLIADVFPPGVFNVVTGDGEHAGAALVSHPLVRIVSLTGEVTTGKIVMKAAADSLKRVHLELGGKAPVVVFDDADLDAVVAGVRDVRVLELRPGLHGGDPCHRGTGHPRRPRERPGRTRRRASSSVRRRPMASSWGR